MKEPIINLIPHLVTVYDHAEKCKLTDLFFSKMQQPLTLIAQHFNITERQAFWVALIYGLHFEKEECTQARIADYVQYKTVCLVAYRKDFEALTEKGIIEANSDFYLMVGMRLQAQAMNLSEEALDAIEVPQAFVSKKENKQKDLLGFLDAVIDLQNGKQQPLFLRKFKQICNDFNELPLVNKISKLQLSFKSEALLVLVICQRVYDNDGLDLSDALKLLHSKQSDKLRERQSIIKGEHELLERDFLELEPKGIFGETSLGLTDTCIDLLTELGLEFTIKKEIQPPKNIISHSSIKIKELYYNQEEQKQIDYLSQSLVPISFKKLQERLSEKALPKGIAVLLHGAPGTGKTESVYQIAKKTQRDIMHVDISASKSCWFGESEKQIKKIFDRYHRLKLNADGNAPILFFNEADAILSRRKDVNSSNIAQTENAIQNILLEELEKFNGIMFATTNFANNLDPAFERRFLFKVKFDKPERDVCAQIWASKLKDFSEEDYKKLSTKFNFSGGQIENIVRKVEICQILENRKPNIDEIFNYCSHELLETQHTKPIGFNLL